MVSVSVSHIPDEWRQLKIKPIFVNSQQNDENWALSGIVLSSWKIIILRVMRIFRKILLSPSRSYVLDAGGGTPMFPY